MSRTIEELCDTAPDSTVTRFWRILEVESGEVVGDYADMDLSVPYTVRGTVAECAPEPSPVRRANPRIGRYTGTDPTPVFTILPVAVAVHVLAGAVTVQTAGQTADLAHTWEDTATVPAGTVVTWTAPDQNAGLSLDGSIRFVGVASDADYLVSWVQVTNQTDEESPAA